MTQQQSCFTQSEHKHAMRILGDESAFCCIIERKRKYDWLVVAMPQIHTCDWCLYFVFFLYIFYGNIAISLASNWPYDTSYQSGNRETIKKSAQKQRRRRREKILRSRAKTMDVF